jgi:hypothetical protein
VNAEELTGAELTMEVTRRAYMLAAEREIDALRTQLAEAEARETALREALEDSDNAWEDDNLADLMTARGFRWARALSGEQGEQE